MHHTPQWFRRGNLGWAVESGWFSVRVLDAVGHVLLWAFNHAVGILTALLVVPAALGLLGGLVLARLASTQPLWYVPTYLLLFVVSFFMLWSIKVIFRGRDLFTELKDWERLHTAEEKFFAQIDHDFDTLVDKL